MSAKPARLRGRNGNPLGDWAHVALVPEGGTMKHYVNGQLELQGDLDFRPINSGRTSIGVRLNKVHWYKGAIGSIRITPQALNPETFPMNHNIPSNSSYEQKH